MKSLKKLVFVVLMSILLISSVYQRDDFKAAQSTSLNLSGMTRDQIAKALDPNQKAQDFIVLNPQQVEELKGYTVTETIAKEDFGTVNSTMWGYEYGIYKINGHFVFCIEPGYDTLNSANKVDESGSIFNKFKQGSKTYVTRVISSAIGHYNSTENESYVFAGQLLIWDYVATHEAEKIGNAMESWNPNYLQSFTIHKSIYEPQIKEIEQDLREWTTLPSFLGTSTKPQKHTLKYDSKAEEYSLILTDENHVWDKKYANYDDYGNYSITNPSGTDNVKITTKTANSSYSEKVKYTWEPSISNKKELYDAGQDLIYVGAKVVNGYLQFNTEDGLGGFKLEKKGEMSSTDPIPLESVEFTLTAKNDSSFKQVYKTDSKGVINSGLTLKPGEYYLKETKAPSNYNQDFTATLVIKDHKVTEVNNGKPIINHLYTNAISFKKTGLSLESDDWLGLKGVEFELYSETGDINQVIDEDDQLVETLISDENGIVKSSQLPVGNYIVKESKTIEGYNLSEQTVSFKIANDGTINSGGTIDLGDFKNEVITGQVELSKLGVGYCEEKTDCSKPLANVKFDIYRDVNNDYQLSEDEQVSIDSIVTNDNGYGISSNLKYGHYYLQEVSNPDANYELNPAIFEFDIINQSEVVKVNNDQPITNQQKLGKLRISKSGEQQSEGQKSMLSGAEYTIYNAAEEIVDVLITDDNGVASSKPLPLGSYYIRETKAPVSYALDQSKFAFDITADNYKQALNLEFTDRKISNEIIISKIDGGNGQELPGATIEVISRDTDEIVEKWISTNEPHKISVDYGKYKICEQIAPDGYKLEKSCTNFEVTEDGARQEFTIENKVQKMAVTGIESRKRIIAILVLAAFILLINLFKRIFIKTIA